MVRTAASTVPTASCGTMPFSPYRPYSRSTTQYHNSTTDTNDTVLLHIAKHSSKVPQDVHRTAPHRRLAGTTAVVCNEEQEWASLAHIVGCFVGTVPVPPGTPRPRPAAASGAPASHRRGRCAGPRARGMVWWGGVGQRRQLTTQRCYAMLQYSSIIDRCQQLTGSRYFRRLGWPCR